MKIKTRFAPSPTGFLHVGGLRTALFAYLFAKKNNGDFLLRIEDTDRERFVEGGVENILNSLHWAGIKTDEGVLLEKTQIIESGNSGPYIQSKRLDIYKKYAEQLIKQGDAYYCFCSKDRLDELRKIQQLNKQATGYDGHCRNLSSEDIKKKLDAGESYVIRMKMPKDGFTEVDDMVRGKVKFSNSLVDDQVIVKADGFPTYHFAVVVDDNLMGVTHVIRGEEWLPSTPKHINLYEMLGFDLPKYAHLSLLINEKKQKLSKRHGDVSVEDFREAGYLSEALVNFIAFLGWNPGDDREIFSLKDLEKEFSFEKVGKAPSVFDREKLDWYNQHYIMNMESGDLVAKVRPFFENYGVNLDKYDFDLDNLVKLEQGRATTLKDIVEKTAFLFTDKLEYESELLIWKKSTKEDAKEKLELILEFLGNIEGEWSKEKLEEKVLSWIKEHDFGNGDVLWPMRVAMSGQKNSPGPFEIAGVLGQKQVLSRIKTAIARL